MTTVEDIKEWFDEGLRKKQKWMIVVCDTFDYDDYPVYASNINDFDRQYASHNNQNMQRIMEVYDLSKDFAKQKIGRVWNIPVESRYSSGKDPLLSWIESKEIK